MTDDCGSSFNDTITITVGEDTSYVDLGPDRIICDNPLVQLDATTEMLPTFGMMEVQIRV